MPEHGNPLMARPAVARLRRAAAGEMARVLAGQAGGLGLSLCMGGHPAESWPRTQSVIRLELAAEHWQGDVRARVDEALPFVDEAFQVVLLDHVLEWTPYATNLLDEASRVLEAGGYLGVAGFHPFSAWMPWLLCRRRPRPMLTAPGWVRQRLNMHGVDTLQVHRCGMALPTAVEHTQGHGFGGGFVLVARKRRASIMALKPLPRVRQKSARQPAAWAPGTHRECA